MIDTLKKAMIVTISANLVNNDNATDVSRVILTYCAPTDDVKKMTLIDVIMRICELAHGSAWFNADGEICFALGN